MSHIIYLCIRIKKNYTYNINKQKLNFYHTSENMLNKFRNPSRETLNFYYDAIPYKLYLYE